MVLHFHRVMSDNLLEELRPTGRFAGLVARRNTRPDVADVQLRRARGNESHASLYIGLTSVLDVRERAGEFALRARATHRAAADFDAAWATFRPAAALAADWPAVEQYLDRILSDGKIEPRWYRREGMVQTAVASGASSAYGPVQREAVVWADGEPSVAQLVAATSDHVWAAVKAANRSDPWWPAVRGHGLRPGMGDEVDAIAVDGHRLLCIEVKPAVAVEGIVWSAAQVLVYAELFARWAAQDPALASQSLAAMAAQRHALGLLDQRWTDPLPDGFTVTPVVAIGAGARNKYALPRLHQLTEALGTVPTHPLVDPLEVWLLNESGHPTQVWLPATEPLPPVP